MELFPNYKRHLSSNPAAISVPLRAHVSTSFLVNRQFWIFDDDLLAAFLCDIVIWIAETPDPKSWGYGTHFSSNASWKIHAWREGYHQDLAWWWECRCHAIPSIARHESSRGLGDIRLRPNCGSIQMQENQEELSSSLQTGLQVRLYTISWKGFLVFQHPVQDSSPIDTWVFRPARFRGCGPRSSSGSGSPLQSIRAPACAVSNSGAVKGRAAKFE